jgi:hypothetical protein
MESWEAETSTENTETVGPHTINLEDTLKGGSDSDNWPVPLG